MAEETVYSDRGGREETIVAGEMTGETENTGVMEQILVH